MHLCKIKAGEGSGWSGRQAAGQWNCGGKGFPRGAFQGPVAPDPLACMPRPAFLLAGGDIIQQGFCTVMAFHCSSTGGQSDQGPEACQAPQPPLDPAHRLLSIPLAQKMCKCLGHGGGRAWVARAGAGPCWKEVCTCHRNSGIRVLQVEQQREQAVHDFCLQEGLVHAFCPHHQLPKQCDGACADTRPFLSVAQTEQRSEQEGR